MSTIDYTANKIAALLESAKRAGVQTDRVNISYTNDGWYWVGLMDEYDEVLIAGSARYSLVDALESCGRKINEGKK